MRGLFLLSFFESSQADLYVWEGTGDGLYHSECGPRVQLGVGPWFLFLVGAVIGYRTVYR